MELVDLLPESGSVAVFGEEIEERLIRSIPHAERDISLVPLTPDQVKLALSLDIPIMEGMPDYLYMVADFEPKEGYFTVGRCPSPFKLRLAEIGAERVIVLLRQKYRTVSVEYLPFLHDDIEPLIALYGNTFHRRESPFGNSVIELVPDIDDVEELRSKIKDIPGVIEVSIIPTVPYKKIYLREM